MPPSSRNTSCANSLDRVFPRLSRPGISGFLATCTLLLRLSGSAEARTWTVREGGGGTAPTIQAAVDSCADGDTLDIGPGVFYERRIDIVDKTLLVRGAGRDLTEVNGFPPTGSQHGSTFAIRGVNNYTEIRSLTIKEGVANSPADITGSGIYGGGVVGIGAKFALVDCRITSCSAMSLGGGVYGTSLASAPGPGGPPAFRAAPPQPGTPHDTILLSNCLIDGNIASSEGGGFCFESAYFRIENCTIQENFSVDGGGGRLFNSVGTMTGCLVWKNHAEWDGGGLDTEQNIPWNGTSMLLARNTIVENTALHRGSAVFITNGVTISYEQNLFAGNGGGAQAVIECRLPDGEYHGSCNHFGSNSGERLIDCAPVETDTGGDPLFCNPAGGDFRLCAASPAISALCGPRGAFGVGCSGPSCTTNTRSVTWSGLKLLYR